MANIDERVKQLENQVASIFRTLEKVLEYMRHDAEISMDTAIFMEKVNSYMESNQKESRKR